MTMTPDSTRELVAEAEKHQELVVCGNAQHTNFDVGCPDCAVVCDYCTCPWPCDARKCADALAALTTPQEERSAAKVVPVSYEASASCSHGVCPSGCSHLMWACSVCSCEGGWGASMEQLEEIAAKHECQPAWSGGNATDSAFEAWEQELWKHQPVLSMEDGSIRGCQCLDRVFHRGTEDWGTHLAEVFSVLGRDVAGEIEAVAKLKRVEEYARDRAAHARHPILNTVGSARIASDLFDILGIDWPDGDEEEGR